MGKLEIQTFIIFGTILSVTKSRPDRRVVLETVHGIISTPPLTNATGSCNKKSICMKGIVAKYK